jgi:hypothetical protein
LSRGRAQDQAQGGTSRIKALSPEIANVNVGAQPDVVGEIPAFVVGVFEDRDIVAIPKPVVGIGKVKRGDAEVISAKPEAAGIASLDTPPVFTAEAAVEAAMLPGVIDVEAHIIAATFVSDPFAVVVDVRGFRVAFAVVVGAPRVFVMIFTMFFPSLIGRRAVAGNVSSADVVVAVASVVMVPVVVVVSLSQHGQGEDEE